MKNKFYCFVAIMLIVVPAFIGAIAVCNMFDSFEARGYHKAKGKFIPGDRSKDVEHVVTFSDGTKAKVNATAYYTIEDSPIWLDRLCVMYDDSTQLKCVAGTDAMIILVYTSRLYEYSQLSSYIESCDDQYANGMFALKDATKREYEILKENNFKNVRRISLSDRDLPCVKYKHLIITNVEPLK